MTSRRRTVLDAWTAAHWDSVPPNPAFVGLWEPNSDIFGCATGDSWLDHVKETNGQSDQQSVLVINQSRLGDPGYDPTQWKNIRIEADFRADTPARPRSASCGAPRPTSSRATCFTSRTSRPRSMRSTSASAPAGGSISGSAAPTPRSAPA